MNHAKIRFHDSRDKFKLHPVSFIKYRLTDKASITPKNPDDFEATHTYYGNRPCEDDDCFDNHPEHYYPCLILSLAESLKDFEEQSSKRTRIPRVINDLGSLRKPPKIKTVLENDKKKKKDNYRSQISARSNNILDQCSKNKKKKLVFKDSSSDDESLASDNDKKQSKKYSPKKKKSVLQDITNKPRVKSSQTFSSIQAPFILKSKTNNRNEKTKHGNKYDENRGSTTEDLTLSNKKRTYDNTFCNAIENEYEGKKNKAKNTEDKQIEDEISEDKKSQDEKSEDEKSEDETSEDEKTEDEKSEDEKTEDKKSEYEKIDENDDNEEEENKDNEEEEDNKKEDDEDSDDTYNSLMRNKSSIKRSLKYDSKNKSELSEASIILKKKQTLPTKFRSHCPKNAAGNAINDQQNAARQRKGRRKKSMSKQEYILHCLEYYESGHGVDEKHKRYEMNNEREIYLGEGIWVGERKWNLIQLNPPLKFLKVLTSILWDEYDLGNRALDLSKVRNNIPNRSPVKLIEQNGLRLLISLFDDFLTRNKNKFPDKESFLLDVTPTLKYIIRTLREDLISEADPTRRKRTGQLQRYNAVVE